MTTATRVQPAIETVADLLKRLGDVPPERVRMHPPPGTATEADVLAPPHGDKRMLELADGVLVEKPMGFYESVLAAILIRLIGNFIEERDLGIVVAPDGLLRIGPGLVRMPDVAFIAWDRIPDRKLPRQPIADLAPDLAVEILSASNTKAEMERKLQEYFAAGTRLVWYVEPESRRVRVYTSPEAVRVLGEDETLDGGAVLPGFRLPIRDWFDRAGERQEG